MGASEGRSPSADGNPVPERPDAEWFRLTEGMASYERFRFIARHVIAAAVEQVRAYAEDDRIFPDLEDEAAINEHLAQIEQAIEEDTTLSAVERRFLCAAVAEAMADRDMQAACPWQELVRLAAVADGNGEGHLGEKAG